MTGVRRSFLLLFLILILGGFIFLATWDAAPPQQRIEFSIPDDRLPR